MSIGATRGSRREPFAGDPEQVPLEVTVACDQPLPGVLVVRLCGELDIGTVAPVREALVIELSRTTPRRLVLDLSEVTFMSSRGIGLLISLLKDARSRSFHLVLAGTSHRCVRRPLRLAGVLPLFDTRLDVAHALADADIRSPRSRDDWAPAHGTTRWSAT